MGGPSVQETYPCNIYTRYYFLVYHNSQHHHIIFCLMALCCLHCAAKKYWQSFECHYCGRRCFGSPQQTYYLWNYQERKPSIAALKLWLLWCFFVTWHGEFFTFVCVCLAGHQEARIWHTCHCSGSCAERRNTFSLWQNLGLIQILKVFFSLFNAFVTWCQ